MKVSLETEKKLLQQGDEIYFPGKDEKAEKDDKAGKDDKPGKDDKAAKKSEAVRDEVLDRAVELLKAREVLGNLKPGK